MRRSLLQSYNETEAGLICTHLIRFLETYSKKTTEKDDMARYTRITVGIICPYTAQKATIQSHIDRFPGPYRDMINVNTVDGFQGQERDIIIVSLTRCGATEFLNAPERMNVACTRAKYSLWLFGDQATFAPMLAQKHMNGGFAEDDEDENSLGQYRSSVWERFVRHCNMISLAFAEKM